VIADETANVDAAFSGFLESLAIRGATDAPAPHSAQQR
jgi:hypothetical protein